MLLLHWLQAVGTPFCWPALCQDGITRVMKFMHHLNHLPHSPSQAVMEKKLPRHFDFFFPPDFLQSSREDLSLFELFCKAQRTCPPGREFFGGFSKIPQKAFSLFSPSLITGKACIVWLRLCAACCRRRSAPYCRASTTLRRAPAWCTICLAQKPPTWFAGHMEMRS